MPDGLTAFMLGTLVVAVFGLYVLCVEMESRRRFPDDQHEHGPFGR